MDGLTLTMEHRRQFRGLLLLCTDLKSLKGYGVLLGSKDKRIMETLEDKFANSDSDVNDNVISKSADRPQSSHDT